MDLCYNPAFLCPNIEESHKMNELSTKSIKDKIYTIRDTQVMLDKDLAELYGVETKRVNEAVKNNTDKFPSDFYFKLSSDEFEILQSKISTAKFAKTRVMPKVFTEQGIYMLATILKSPIATQASLFIIRTFAQMRHIIANTPFERFERIEQRLNSHDESIAKLSKALQSSEPPKQGIFYDGQIYEAHIFVSSLIKKAKKRIILVDNYIDETTLTLFSKNPHAKITLYTKSISKSLQLDIDKFNAQFKNAITIKEFALSHDRFLIIDDEIYHFGASLKDLGKKWFAFSKIDNQSLQILQRLESRI